MSETVNWMPGEATDPVINLWYSTLIEMTRTVTYGERLLEGGGNLVTPADPHFTACCLTDAGRTFAERILGEHPEWDPNERQSS